MNGVDVCVYARFRHMCVHTISNDFGFGCFWTFSDVFRFQTIQTISGSGSDGPVSDYSDGF